MCFVLFSYFLMFLKKKNWIGGWWLMSDQSEFFSDFWIFFNLTRPLTEYIKKTLGDDELLFQCKDNVADVLRN